MAIEDEIPGELPTTEAALTPLLSLLVVAATLLGAAHHIDHVVRGNHVGWPLTAHVNPFT